MTSNDNNYNQGDFPVIEVVKLGFVKVKGGAENWDWDATSTRHVTGIQRKDVEDLIKKGAEYIVLSKGMEDRLETPKETENFLKEEHGMTRGINYFIETTPGACKRYNQLVAAKKRVGALIHSTC